MEPHGGVARAQPGGGAARGSWDGVGGGESNPWLPAALQQRESDEASWLHGASAGAGGLWLAAGGGSPRAQRDSGGSGGIGSVVGAHWGSAPSPSPSPPRHRGEPAREHAAAANAAAWRAPQAPQYGGSAASAGQYASAPSHAPLPPFSPHAPEPHAPDAHTNAAVAGLLRDLAAASLDARAATAAQGERAQLQERIWHLQARNAPLRTRS